MTIASDRTWMRASSLVVLFLVMGCTPAIAWCRVTVRSDAARVSLPDAFRAFAAERDVRVRRYTVRQWKAAGRWSHRPYPVRYVYRKMDPEEAPLRLWTRDNRVRYSLHEEGWILVDAGTGSILGSTKDRLYASSVALVEFLEERGFRCASDPPLTENDDAALFRIPHGYRSFEEFGRDPRPPGSR